MSDTESRILQEANRHQRWGFSVQVQKAAGTGVVSAPPFVSDALLTLDVPAWMARAWNVTLAPFGFAGTVGGNLVNTQPAGNQVWSRSRTRCQIDFGVDGAAATLVMDYPARGATVTLVASNMRVKIFSELAFGGLAQLPIFSGWLAPAQRSVTGGDISPAFTTQQNTVAPAGSTVFPIPAFATSYRVWTDVLQTTGELQLFQCDDGQNPVEFDGVVPQNAGAAEAAGYYVLKPFAQFVQVNNVGAGAHNVGLQFMLDVG